MRAAVPLCLRIDPGFEEEGRIVAREFAHATQHLRKFPGLPLQVFENHPTRRIGSHGIRQATLETIAGHCYYMTKLGKGLTIEAQVTSLTVVVLFYAVQVP
jgi:hypothetical protein